MWIRNGNIFKYVMNFLFQHNDISTYLLHYIQLLLLNIANPVQYLIERFGMKDERVECNYNVNFIRFLLTCFNNYPYGKEYEKLNMKEYIISLLSSKDYSFGQIISKIQKYFYLKDSIEVNKICDEIIKELKCILTPRQLFESSYFTLNPNIVYDYDIFSIYSYINSKINFEKIKFTPYINTEFNSLFSLLQDVYKSPFYLNFMFDLLEKYNNGNSIVLNEYLLWMMIRSLIFYPNELILLIKTKYVGLIEMLCGEYNKNEKNELLKYILENLSKKDEEVLNKIIKNHLKEKVDVKKTNKDLIAKKMALMKRKQAAFTSTLPSEYNMSPTTPTPSPATDSTSEIHLCFICKEEEKKDNPFIYYVLNQNPPIFSNNYDNIPIYTFCGHYIHKNCYFSSTEDIVYRRNRDFMSPFNRSEEDRRNIDTWYIYIYMFIIFIIIFLSFFIYIFCIVFYVENSTIWLFPH